jgi:hypothetical protein
VKNTARKQLIVTAQLAQDGSASYGQIINAALLEHSPQLEPVNGKPVVQWLSLFGAIQDTQVVAFDAVVETIEDQSFRTFVRNNDGASGTLAQWFLAFVYCRAIFRSCIMSNPLLGAPKRDLFDVTDAAGAYALGYANIVTASQWDDSARYMFGELSARAAGMAANEQGWRLPPYQF